MLGLHRAAADIDRRTHDGSDVEQVEGQARADDIGNRIGGAHLVKVHLLDGHLVDLRFGLAQPLEYRQYLLFGAVRQVRTFR